MNIKTIELPGIIKLLPVVNISLKRSEPGMIFAVLLLIWCFAPRFLNLFDERVGSIDQSIWLLILLSMISFLLITALSWWLLQWFWLLMKLPALTFMVSQFNFLPSWQQLGFYWVSFALLLLAASACLIAIC